MAEKKRKMNRPVVEVCSKVLMLHLLRWFKMTRTSDPYDGLTSRDEDRSSMRMETTGV